MSMFTHCPIETFTPNRTCSLKHLLCWKIQQLVLITICTLHHQYSDAAWGVVQPATGVQKQNDKQRNLTSNHACVRSASHLKEMPRDCACFSMRIATVCHFNLCGITTGMILQQENNVLSSKNQFVMKQLMHPCAFLLLTKRHRMWFIPGQEQWSH